MKKLFTIFAAVLFASSMMAEGVLFEQTYPGAPSEFTTAYTKTFTITAGDYTLTYANINNGKESDNWSAVRAGRKSDASVATVTSGAIAEKVSKVVVSFTQVDASKTNELYLLVSPNEDFSEATKVTASLQVGDVAFVIAEPAENKYYQLGMDMVAHGSSNGFNRFEKIQFLVAEGGTPVVPVKYDTLTVAQAIEKADALADNVESAEKYYVEGYAVNVVEYSAQYNNQDFFLVDDPSKPANDLKAYRAVPMKDGKAYPVLEGDQVRLFGRLQKYVKDNETILEVVTPTVEFLKEVEGDRGIQEPVEPKVDTITVAEAIAEAQKLTPAEKQSASTEKSYAVKGYIANIKNAYDEKYGNMTFYMSDDPTADKGDLQAYRCKISADDAAKAIVGAYVLVTGQIQNYNGGTYNSYEISQGTVELLGEAPEIQVISVNVAEALEIGNALADNAATAETYAVTGYVTKAFDYDTENSYQNFYMADNAEDYGEFYAFKAKPATPVKDGDKVILTGKIKKYVSKDGTKTTIEIENGQVEILSGAGIENVVLTDKVQKVVLDGVLYIVRDGKMFNVQGAQVR